MAVIVVKATNYAFLEKIGISQTRIEKLVEKNIKISIGFYDLNFVNDKMEPVATAKLTTNTNAIVKNNVTAQEMALIKEVVNVAIDTAINGGTIITKPKVAEGVVPSSNSDSVSSPFKPAPIEASAPTKTMSPAMIVKAPPVPLKSATMMYQPVNGTSKGSRYFVVAMNGHCKVAARMQGNNLSMRVEGDLSVEMVQAFAKVNIEGSGGGYLSGHFDCNSNVTPARVIGAILFGTGLAFDTPIPNLNVINNIK